MKKIATILITAFLIAGMTASALACGPGLQGHSGQHRGTVNGWHQDRYGHDRGRQVVYPRQYERSASYHGERALTAFPAVPVAGVAFFFPGISVSIH